ncbi:MAG: helix-turn-helix domain-containing protein, partial [Solirubrobacterales bacterium]
GFPRRHGQLLPVAAVWRREALGDGVTFDEAWGPLLAPMRGALSEPDRPALIGSRGNCVLGVLDRGTKGSEPDGSATRERLATRFRAALGLHEVDPEQVVLAIGGVAESWDEISGALNRARLAAEAGAVGPARTWHDASRTEVGQLLLSMRGTPELLAFSDERLGPLLEVGGDRGRDLLETLEVYLHSGGRKTEAAQALEIERQSLYHRLVRIESILGVELKDGDTALALHLAVMIRRLLSR